MDRAAIQTDRQGRQMGAACRLRRSADRASLRTRRNRRTRRLRAEVARMSGPFDLPPDPFDDELDRLLPPLPERGPPKPNGEDNTGMQWGQRDVVRFCRDIDDIDTLKAGIELARAMLTEGFVFEGDITIELIRAARRSGISDREIARQIDSLYNWHPSEDEEEQEREALATINASSFAGKAIPIRQYLDGFEFFIRNDASFLTGAGAIGKTLVILQLAAAVAYPVEAIAETNWLGNAVKVRGKVLFYSGEEDSDELHRRLDDICAHEGFDLDRLGDLMICDMAAEEEKALLRPHDKHRDMLVKTSLFASLEKSMEAEKPALLIIDNKAQIIKGNEMSRDVATDVVNVFRALAKRHGCTVVILAHPSMSGIAQKTGASGSTGWINTTRGQVNMRHPDDEQEGPDDGRRILVAQKGQLQPTGTRRERRLGHGLLSMHRQAGTRRNRHRQSGQGGTRVPEAHEVIRAARH
ncbi:AAA family ATPase [Sinorhizobium medicae]|nr:AAA family ATPase [Sinorhizobium medicae]MDX0442310.1 AAA family ATPase [Sinorhizobium medicae]MDX0463848.1 AAA family ATPase [Sinorhizobium medicae]MDX0537639.1 AAA family ATPase [Sinorhizobium medicae]MDX0572410.1 AAA family ATPase [Sinorhizobium medicae]